jgi:hypothetical protein
LRLAQTIDRYRRNLGPAEFTASQDSTMTRYHIALGVDERRGEEPERLDRPRDLPDLLPAVTARIPGIKF